jgi:hypothetical protein
MTTRQIILLLMVSALSAMCTQAQTQRTITLAVSDTIVLQPTKIYYQIELGDQQMFMGVKIPSGDQDDNVQPVSLEDIRTRLQKEKFNLTMATSDGYELNKSTSSYKALVVELDSEKELQRLLTALRSTNGISGTVKRVEHEPFTKYQQAFFAELLAKGRQEATVIAQAAGLKLGAVLTITEVPATSDGYMRMMEQMMKNPAFRSILSQETGLADHRVRTLMIQFEAQ